MGSNTRWICQVFHFLFATYYIVSEYYFEAEVGQDHRKHNLGNKLVREKQGLCAVGCGWPTGGSQLPPPRFFSKVMQYSDNFKVKPILSKFWVQGPPGVKTPLGPPWPKSWICHCRPMKYLIWIQLCCVSFFISLPFCVILMPGKFTFWKNSFQRGKKRMNQTEIGTKKEKGAKTLVIQKRKLQNDKQIRQQVNIMSSSKGC